MNLINMHFWMAPIGTVIYIASMWVAGITQGIMWRAINDDGTLTYTFVEALKATYPYYIIRWVGGLMFLGGMFVMAYNAWKTIRGAGQTSTNAAAQPA